MKLLVIAFLSVLLTATVIFYSDRSPTPVEPPPVTIPIKVISPTLYNPSEVSSLLWKVKEEEIVLKKKDSLSKAAQWAFERRLILLSKLSLIPVEKISQPIGEILINTKTDELRGSYSDKTFRWDSGPAAGQGLQLEKNTPIKDIFAEGLWGFKTHLLTLCDQRKVTSVVSSDWELSKQKNGEWLLNGKDQVRPNSLQPLLEKVCHVEVEAFDIFAKTEKASSAFNINFGSKKIEVKREGDLFSAPGIPSFRSQSLKSLLSKEALSDLRDTTADIASIAVDRSKPQEDRIKSIRALRGNSSPEALKALRAIVFENTDIDLYRYEAVDTLAATNTKASFKIIQERLAQVGRSGFELRMARALAGAMGRFFRSDEKTPESERRPEVDELLKAAESHPPGKDLAIKKSE